MKHEEFLVNVEKLLYADIARTHDFATDDQILLWEDIRMQIHGVRLVDAADCRADYKFYTVYDNRYDYSYDTLDRGLTLGYFIEEHPQYMYLTKTPKPKHFHQLPLEVRVDYMHYLDHELQVQCSVTNYCEYDAIEEFAESLL